MPLIPSMAGQRTRRSISSLGTSDDADDDATFFYTAFAALSLLSLADSDGTVSSGMEGRQGCMCLGE